jgi:putative membrane protein
VNDDTPPQPQDTTPPASDTNVRDHLANERTLLAWSRTAVAIMALGFVVARFGLLIRELGPGQPQRLPTGTSTVFGVVLVLLGTALLVLGTVRYLRVGEAIQNRAFRWSPGLGLALGGLLLLTGLVLAIYLILTA